MQAALGRGTGGHVARSLELADEIRARGLRLKLNTVVTALKWREDMSAFVRRAQPERWKVFQVLPIGGQNDGAVDDLLIDAGQFQSIWSARRPPDLRARASAMVGVAPPLPRVHEARARDLRGSTPRPPGRGARGVEQLRASRMSAGPSRVLSAGPSGGR